MAVENIDIAKSADDLILKEMMERADRLCESGDALLRGQYEHLRGRIQALLGLRCTGDLGSTSP
jgi:hypothetical protein